MITGAEPTTTSEQDTAAAVATNRMAVAVFALAGVLIALYMLLHKLGVISTLACGEGTCEVVQNSPWAVFIGVPVPAWGVAGYGLILALALLGLQPAWATDRRLAALLFASAAVAFVFTAYLNWLEAFVIHAWCRWCIGSAVVATLIFVFALPEIGRMRAKGKADG